ncbi:IS66 family insertion sequence element accessory protein TnpA [Halomonas flagellata]
MSQRAFCEQKGLSKSSFQLWKRRQGDGGSGACGVPSGQ